MKNSKKILEKKKDEILLLLNRNDSVRTTAQLIGVSKDSLYKYLKDEGFKRSVKWIKLK